MPWSCYTLFDGEFLSRETRFTSLKWRIIDSIVKIALKSFIHDDISYLTKIASDLSLATSARGFSSLTNKFSAKSRCQDKPAHSEVCSISYDVSFIKISQQKEEETSSERETAFGNLVLPDQDHRATVLTDYEGGFAVIYCQDLQAPGGADLSMPY